MNKRNMFSKKTKTFIRIIVTNKNILQAMQLSLSIYSFSDYKPSVYNNYTCKDRSWQGPKPVESPEHCCCPQAFHILLYTSSLGANAQMVPTSSGIIRCRLLIGSYQLPFKHVMGPVCCIPNYSYSLRHLGSHIRIWCSHPPMTHTYQELITLSKPYRYLIAIRYLPPVHVANLKPGHYPGVPRSFPIR